jgi:hypothetical protein
VCAACRGGRDLCRFCADRLEETAATSRERRRSRLALRRAGVALRHEPGDPVVLREGPFRLVVPLLGGAATLLAVAAAGVELRLRWEVDAALTALLCAAAVGLWVRMLLGGVSRTAGLIAGTLCVAGAWAAGSRGGLAGAEPTLSWMGDVSTWLLSHTGAATALYALAALLAYSTAAGHRAGRSSLGR